VAATSHNIRGRCLLLERDDKMLRLGMGILVDFCVIMLL